MPLDYSDQMSILKDILSNHQSDCCGTVSECEQIERLIKSMLGNETTNEQVKNTLYNIYDYSQSAKNTQHLDQHIQTNQQNLSQWVSELDSLS
ncbi:MAG TPA: YtzH-like family protein [Bacillus sp. (in: firmicutes)]|nr:YtzH-like family protein [Bacillus sp. (in: firmicutes)]